MTFSDWLSLAAVCTLGAMSPGPSLAVILRHTLKNSRRHGLAAAVSHGAGVGLYALLVLIGLGSLVTALPILAQIITWAGAGYLAWLGVKALMTAEGAHLEVRGHEVRAEPIALAVREGFLVAFFNPKLAVFFTALFAQFIDQDQSISAQALMASTAWLIDTGWYLAVAMVISRPPWLQWLRRRSAWIDRITGVLLLAIALRVLTF